VPYKKDRLIGLPFPYHIKEGSEGICEVLEPLNVNPNPFRFPVTDVINPIDGVAQRDKVIHKVHIAPAVFGQAMYNYQDSPWFNLWQPSLIVVLLLRMPLKNPS